MPDARHWTGEDDRDLDPARDAPLRLRRQPCATCGQPCAAMFIGGRRGGKRARAWCEHCLRLKEATL